MSGIIGGYSNVNQGLLAESRDFIVEDSHPFKVDVKQNNCFLCVSYVGIVQEAVPKWRQRSSSTSCITMGFPPDYRTLRSMERLYQRYNARDDYIDIYQH